MKYLVIVIFLLLNYSCINQQDNELKQTAKEECIVIDVEKCLKSKKQFLLSTIADSIEYLRLVTPNDVVITKIKKVVMSMDNFFLHSNFCVYQFDRDGMFMRQIGKRGKGPGEYTMAMDFFVDTLRNIVGISHYPNLSFYSLMNGVHVKTIEFKNPDIAIHDSIMLGSTETMGIYKHRMIGINDQLDTLLTLPNYTFYRQSGTQYGSGKKIRDEFYNYDGNTYYKGYEENDTVWKINKLSLEPHIYFNMGKYKLPLKYEVNVSPEKFEANGKKFRCVPRVGEDMDYIYFNINFRSGGGIIDYCALYDKKQKLSFTVHGEKEAGMKDDLLNGPDFWPMHINEDYYISYIEAYLLIDYLDKTPRLINEDLKKQIQGLSMFSNQLLILCKKKEFK